MSIISSRSAKDREGFTPYHSGSDFNEKQLSLFSKLNLNDQIQLQHPLHHELMFDKFSSDLLSVGSKKRKLSEQLMNSSKIGNKTFLNRSLIGKSSLNGQLMIEMESNYSQDHLKKDISENSCPAVIHNEDHSDIFFQHEKIQEQKPKFAKTKNLLRNLSNYMHKFVLYNKRAEGWVLDYFRNKLMKIKRKQSMSQSMSNKSEGQQIEMSPLKSNIQNQINANPLEMAQSDIPEILFQKLKMQEEEKLVKTEQKYKQQAILQNQQNQQMQQTIQKQRKQFNSWISELSIGNFNDYQNIWTRPHKFRALYRVICYKYYKSQAVCDIYRSRLTTKEISVGHLCQFIEGILQPSQFNHFK